MGILGPIVILGIFAGVAGLFIYTARRQNAASSALFKGYADKNGYSYKKSDDDGAIKTIASPFSVFTRFNSPSLGKMEPHDIVSGVFKEKKFCFFLHSTRVYEGAHIPWYVCIIEVQGVSFPFAVIRSNHKSSLKEMLEDYKDKTQRLDKTLGDFEIHTADKNAFDRLMLGKSETMTELLESAPFPVELQMVKNHIARYSVDRNQDIDSEGDITGLIETACNISTCLSGQVGY